MYESPKDLATESLDGNLGFSTESMRVRGLLQKAREELKVERIFGKEYWKSDGNWAYEIRSREGEIEIKELEDEDVTFWEVADKHPLIRWWLEKINEEMKESGIENGEEGFSEAGSDASIRLEDLAI